jgi:hypothetical protein
MPRRKRLCLRQDYRNHAVVVGHLAQLLVDACGQRDCPLKAAVGSLHEVALPVLMLTQGVLFAHDSQRVAVNGDVEVLPVHSGNLDPDNQRLGGLPRFARQHAPPGEVLLRRLFPGGPRRRAK